MKIILQMLGNGYVKADKQLNTVPSCSYGRRNLYTAANFCIMLSIPKESFGDWYRQLPQHNEGSLYFVLWEEETEATILVNNLQQ